jgi:hypothetical protein
MHRTGAGADMEAGSMWVGLDPGTIGTSSLPKPLVSLDLGFVCVSLEPEASESGIVHQAVWSLG